MATDFTALAIWVASAFICYGIAEQKGKNKWIAIAMGLLFGLFAVIGYIFAKGSKEYQAKKLQEKLHELGK